jgi:hypothetical protein
MPGKKVFDTKKLLKMIKDQAPQTEIMKTFGFKTSVQLKNAHYRALVETGEVPAIKSGRRGRKETPVKMVGVGKRGSIILSKEMVEELGIGAGQKFTVRKTKAGIALKRA